MNNNNELMIGIFSDEYSQERLKIRIPFQSLLLNRFDCCIQHIITRQLQYKYYYYIY